MIYRIIIFINILKIIVYLINITNDRQLSLNIFILIICISIEMHPLNVNNSKLVRYIFLAT